MIADEFAPDGLEGAWPNVQGDCGQLDALVSKSLENRLAEVQSRRGRSYSPRRRCEKRLVALQVGSVGTITSIDIWRQRHLTPCHRDIREVVFITRDEAATIFKHFSNDKHRPGGVSSTPSL